MKMRMCSPNLTVLTYDDDITTMIFASSKRSKRNDFNDRISAHFFPSLHLFLVASDCLVGGGG
jgi:hypothetical protein